MDKSTRGYKLVIQCLSSGDALQSAETEERTIKVAKEIQFWKQKKKKNWFCNRPMSPISAETRNVASAHEGKIKILGNVIIQKRLDDREEENDAENSSKHVEMDHIEDTEANSSGGNIENISSISQSLSDFGDPSYVPSDTEVSSSMSFNSMTFDTSKSNEGISLNLNNVSSSTSYGNELNDTADVKTLNIDENGVSNTHEMTQNSNHNDETAEPGVDSNSEQNMSSSIRRTTKKVPKLKNFCYYCEADVLNFARHITNNHSMEFDVIKMMSMTSKCLARRRLLAQIRNKGNFLRSANNFPRRVRRAQLPDTAVLPCDNCLGFFSSKLLYTHRKNCGESRSGRAQSEGQNTLIGNIRVDDRLKREVFPRMRADKVSLEAKSDNLICSFGARYLKTHREKHFATVTSRKMRELAKILMEIKKMEASIKSLFQALQPKYFDLFVQATQVLARYDPNTETFGAPTFAMNIVNSFKKCCDIAINFVLKGSQQYETVPAAEAEAQLRTMSHLFTANWRFEISSQAANNLHLNKWNKIIIVPLASDLQKLRNYLLHSAEKAVEKLQTNNTESSAYNILVETIYCRVILLNRKRPGELQRMLLHTYLNCGNSKAHYEEFERIVTPAERILLNKLKRVVIRGKRGRGVPVLFSGDIQDNIKFMLEQRPNFVPKENVYLFARANSLTEISGYKILSKYAHKCGAKNPTAITSTRLRKHLATLTQIFNMTDNDIEQLATFMGHTARVHRDSYRLPDDIYQTAKLSKLLLLMEKGEAGEYKGKCLEKINLDMEENLLAETKDDDTDLDDEIDSTNTEAVAEANISESMPTESTSSKPLQKTRKKRVLIPWSAQQKRITKKFFTEHIKYSKPPKKADCEKLIENHPHLFKNKNWLKIKVFVQNEYSKKNR